MKNKTGKIIVVTVLYLAFSYSVNYYALKSSIMDRNDEYEIGKANVVFLFSPVSWPFGVLVALAMNIRIL